jgi:hypothetical protein
MDPVLILFAFRFEASAAIPLYIVVLLYTLYYDIVLHSIIY